jgi:hypothetical protein
MALEPGKLTNLGGPNSPGRQEWSQLVRSAHQQSINASRTRCLLAEADADITPTVVRVDWGAFPIHVELCLQSEERANRLLDWTTGMGDRGRLVGHEEYLEWRTVRDPGGKIVRVEMTTELPDYWLTLARHRPSRVLRLAARFAGEPSVAPRDIYGNLNPLAPGVTPDQREAAFIDMMLPEGDRPPRSPYNNGQKAICFMYNGINSLGAAVQLAAFAAQPFAKTVDGAEQPLNGREAISSTRQAAADCRNSDPTIVGGVLAAAFDRRKIVFDDPFGVYIANVERSRILLPDGATPVPEDWFILERGTAGTDPGTDPDRFQRLVLEVPPNPEGLKVGDLIDADTGEPIQFGAQVARLVTVNFLVRVSDADRVDQPRIPVQVIAPGDCGDDPRCRTFQRAFEEFEASQPPALAALAEARGLGAFSRLGRSA